jgi:hypothetical protein
MGRFYQVTPTPVQSQFVEMPLDFMYGQLQAKQGEYDQATALNDSLKGLLDVEVDPRYDLGTLAKKQEEYNALIDEAAKNLERTGDTNAALYGVQDIKRKIAGDKFLKQAPEYWKQIQKDQEDYQKALATGKVPDYYKNYDNYYYSGNQWKGTIDDKGNLQQYTPGQLSQEGKNIFKQAHDMMSGLHASGNEAGWFNVGSDGSIVSVKQGKEEIADKWVKERAYEQAQNFLETPEGQEFIDQQLYYNPNLDNQQLYQLAGDYLHQAGRNQVFKKTKSDKDISFIPEWKRNEQIEAQPVVLPTSDIPINENTTAKQTADKIIKHVENNYSFDKDGNMVSKTLSDAERQRYEKDKELIAKEGREQFEYLWGKDALDAFDKADRLAGSDNQKMDGFKKIRQTAEIIEPGLKNKSDKEVFDLWTNGIKNMTEVGSYQKDYGTQYADALRGQVMSNLPDREVVIMGGKHSNEKKIFTGKDLMENITIKTSNGKEKKLKDLTQEELEKAVAVSGETYGTFDKSGTSKPYYTGTINTTEGPVKVGIQMNNEQANMYSTSNKVATKIVSGDFGYFANALRNNQTEQVIKYDDQGNQYSEEMIPIIQITEKGGGQIDPGYVPVFRGTDGRIKAYGTDGKAVDWEGSEEYKSKLIREGKIDILDQREFNEEQYNSFQRSNVMFNNSRKANTNKIELGEQ